MILPPNCTILVLAVAGAVVSASESLAFEVCRMPCAPNDLACTADSVLCEVKLRTFEVYARQIDAGQPRHELPPIYQDILKPRYPDADLKSVRFVFSDQQPPDNAMTICDVIYFNDSKYVAELREARLEERWTWLLHELAHVEQCAKGGGREQYALRWWNELERAVRESGESIDVFQSTEQLARQLQALYQRVHGTMPMEQAADAKAEAVLVELRACCIAADGTLVPPAPPPAP